MVAAFGDPPVLPITKVIVGSSGHQALAKKSVDLLLRKYGYSRVETEYSAIPFRDS
jgi:hypothetical protein